MSIMKVGREKVGWVKRSAAPPRPWRRLFNSGIAFIVLLIAAVSFLGRATPSYSEQSAVAEKQPSAKKPPRKLRWPKVKVSKETTYFTEPLRPDGSVNYVAAINQLCSEGVTAENNAYVPLLQATGPWNIKKELRQRYFQMLGIAELPEKGDYLVYMGDFPEYKDAQQKSGMDKYEFSRNIWDQHSDASTKPWTKKDYPIWAGLLERNDKLLDSIIEGSRRPRFYVPMVSDGSEMVGEIFMSVGREEVLNPMQMLGPRAMLRLGEGDIIGAWENVLAMYRISHLASQSPLIVSLLGMCDTSQGMAYIPAVEICRHEGLSSAQSLKYMEQLRSLPARRPLAEISDIGERCFALEYLTLICAPDNFDDYFHGDKSDFDLRKMLKNKESLIAVEESDWEKRRDACRKLVSDNNVDWTEVFRRHNMFYDNVVKGIRRPNYPEALSALQSLEADVRRESSLVAEMVLDVKSFDANRLDPKKKSEYIAKLSILHFNFWMWKTCLAVEHRMLARERLLMIALALAAYRAEHAGEYPAALSTLSPAYIDALPKDPFADADFRYRREAGGYVLYSVGPNQKDDGGVNSGGLFASEENGKSGDDIAIRTTQE